jgi:transcriptional regulator with XRE-family HTH domain
MTPEQVRMARASLNWSLDRLSSVSGVHRNTISNFETAKYRGDPDTLASIKQTLESAGVIFDDGSGVQLRRFQVGDRVRLRPNSQVGYGYKPPIRPDEIGKVIGVEPHPPQTGPTYRIRVEFSGDRIVEYTFKFEFELVKVAQKANRDS